MTTEPSTLRFVAVSSLSDAERRQYWAKGVPLFRPWVLTSHPWNCELERLGLSLKQEYFVLREDAA